MRNSCPSIADDRFCTALAASCTPQSRLLKWFLHWVQVMFLAVTFASQHATAHLS